jgi:hypothetical protein
MSADWGTGSLGVDRLAEVLREALISAEGKDGIAGHDVNVVDVLRELNSAVGRLGDGLSIKAHGDAIREAGMAIAAGLSSLALKINSVANAIHESNQAREGGTAESAEA